MFFRIHLRSRETSGLSLDEVSLNSSLGRCRVFPVFQDAELDKTLTLCLELLLGSIFSPGLFLVLVLGWSCANEVEEELTCEQPFEPGQDNSVSAVPLATAFLMGTSSQTEHKKEWLRYGGTALGVGERRCPAHPPPTREFSPSARQPREQNGRALLGGR